MYSEFVQFSDLKINFKNSWKVYLYNYNPDSCRKDPAVNQQLRTQTFEQIFLEATDSALASLGESARQSIYYHLERTFRLPKQDIPAHLDDFENGLEKIFGAGARYIEVLIMKQLFLRVGKHLELDDEKDLEFKGYVAAAKKTFNRNELRLRRA